MGRNPPSAFLSLGNVGLDCLLIPSSAEVLMGDTVEAGEEEGGRVWYTRILSDSWGGAGASSIVQSEWTTSLLGTKALSFSSNVTNCSNMFFLCSKLFLMAWSTGSGYSGCSTTWPLSWYSCTSAWMGAG